jgi:hypothetical protein
MSTREVLEQELRDAPDSILREVYHYLRYLKSQREEERFQGLLASEEVLARDWDTPEEDAAWQNL